MFSSEFEDNIISSVSDCRNQVMTLVEVSLSDENRWKTMRGQLLNLFGHRGLEGKIQDHFYKYSTFSKEKNNGTGNNKSNR